MWDHRSPDHNDDGADTPGAVAGSVAAELVASSSSSSSARRCKYDVFLSFRGPDTRKGITVEIRDQLQSRGVKTFMDDRDLEPGDPISRKLIEAIEGSRYAIVILSPDYASSAWCLEELAKICECMEDENRVLPLFYNVEPSDVRHRKRSFGEAFSKHETSRRQTSDQMQQWRDALDKVASFSGWDMKNFKTERELVEAVVDSVCKRVQPHDVVSTGDFEAYEATRKAMGEIMKALIDDDVTTIGVYGMGGVGKTTLVKHVYAMNCQEKISLNVLSKEDSLTLFLRNARIMSFESTTFEKAVKRVAGECRGLPIALKAVARALGDKDLAEWEKAAQRLEKSQIANPDHEEDAFKCIKLSYDYLKDEEYKSFFLLCCLFPEDYYIKIEDLFRYAIGIGLFRDAETICEARGTAYTVVKYLIDSSLLLEGGYMFYQRCVWMHDVVRDTALNIANSEGGHRFLVKAGCDLDDWPSRLDEGCTAISLMRNRIRKLPPHLVCPKLQILSLRHNNKLRVIPETFFQTPNELRVLDLSRTGISLLPQSFGLLTNLRALYLDCGENPTDISVVGKITTLEVLCVQGAELKELSREIGNLTNLRVLDITGGDNYKIPSKLLSKLHSLEELYLHLHCDFEYWGSKVDGEGDETNSAFDEVTGLSKLRILHVRISNEECIPKLVERNPNWVWFSIWIGEQGRVFSTYPDCIIDQRTIILKLDSISNFPDWFFNTVINKAEELCWEDCPCLIDVFVEYERGRLHSLKQLTVYGDEDDLYGTDDEDDVMNTSTWVPKEPVFENLEELYLGRLDCVELCAVEFLQPGSLRNLKLLHVYSGYNWGNVLLPSTLLERLPNLEELKCSLMGKIEYVFGYEVLLETEQSKLRKIELSHLERVRSLCEGPAPPAMFQNLQSLSITDCNLQGSLFTYDVAQCLSQLDRLDLVGCPLLERIVEASNKNIILPKLKHLTLWQLPVLYYESATFDIEGPSLEVLNLWCCPKFSVSVPDFHSRKQIR